MVALERGCAGEGTAGQREVCGAGLRRRGTDNIACRNKNPLYNAGCEVIFFI